MDSGRLERLDSSESLELQERDKLENEKNKQSQLELMNEDTLLAKRKNSDINEFCEDEHEEIIQISEEQKKKILSRRKDNPLLQGCNSIENY